MAPFQESTILGVRVQKLTVDQLLSFLVESAQNGKKTIVDYANIHTLNLAHDDNWLRSFLNSADLVYCDGAGVEFAAKLLGHSFTSQNRMTAPEYLEELAVSCHARRISMYLLGGKPGVAEQAIIRLSHIAPGLRIKGYHGYFEKRGKENEAVIEDINKFGADIICIGLGMPLQERWIAENICRINGHLYLALGAFLDLYTNHFVRCPKWMTKYGGEWLWRLILEPRRLWTRYFIGNPLFLLRLIEYEFLKGRPSDSV